MLRLLARGLDNKGIAAALRVTTRTVEYHVTNILGKLDVGSWLEAAAWVHEHLSDDLWKSTG
ncbi:MAG: LuxR C-terminal-related transcriptional regulator [Anaerolineae bacterium]|nr:LuxR C-terminal-related transcriptional regulator [Anaerolineae bacterium]